MALQFLELLLKNGPFKKLVHVSGGGGRGRGTEGRILDVHEFFWFISHYSFFGVRSLSWAAERGHSGWFV